MSAMIILPVCAGENRAPPSVAFGSYENFTGWSNRELLCSLESRFSTPLDMPCSRVGIPSGVHCADVAIHGMQVPSALRMQVSLTLARILR